MLRAALHGGPLDGHTTTFTHTRRREPPGSIFVYRANPGLILTAPPAGDPDAVELSFAVYRRTGRLTADGAEIYSCLP